MHSCVSYVTYTCVSIMSYGIRATMPVPTVVTIFKSIHTYTYFTYIYICIYIYIYIYMYIYTHTHTCIAHSQIRHKYMPLKSQQNTKEFSKVREWSHDIHGHHADFWEFLLTFENFPVMSQWADSLGSQKVAQCPVLTFGFFFVSCAAEHLGGDARKNTLQRTSTHCNAQQHTATHCNTLQCTAKHCNTL